MINSYALILKLAEKFEYKFETAHKSHSPRKTLFKISLDLGEHPSGGWRVGLDGRLRVDHLRLRCVPAGPLGIANGGLGVHARPRRGGEHRPRDGLSHGHHCLVRLDRLQANVS